MPLDPKRLKAIDAAVTSIERQFGKGSIMRLGSDELPQVETYSTGGLGLDIALGIGGLPKGRIVEIYGPESSGKTTIALQTIAQCQKAGGVAAFIDAEHALDLTYAEALGIRTDELLVSQPDCGEQALEIAETLVRSNAIDMVVIDSVAALVPRSELEGDMGDATVGAQARLMSQAMRKLTSAINKSNCMMLFINQLRMKIGVMFGSPETTTGGNALKFYATIRLDIRRIGAIKVGDKIVGNRTRVKVVKNKLAPPFKKTEFDIMYGKGISLEGELIDFGLEHNFVRRSGSWYSVGEERVGQGRDNAMRYLRDNPEVHANLVRKIREEYGLVEPLPGTTPAES
jgi:recombination protein RecA